MSSTINADTTNGVVITSDTSGEIELQANGLTKAKITSSGLQNASGNVITSQAGKNKIINGDMRIDQRNAGASVTPTSTGYYSCDRWTPQLTQASKYSVQQSSSAPSGFATSQVFTTVSGYTIGVGDYFGTEQRIEGYNVADLNYGTSNAKTTTLSFWVKSNKTGTFCGSMFTTGTRSYVFNYTISSVNTWEYKTIEITGDTVGTLNTTNGDGLRVRFTLTAGTNFQTSTTNSWIAGNYAVTSGHTNIIATTSDNLYITGVQLEAGTTATPFEQIQYGQQLALCQRYAYMIPNSDTTGVGDGAMVSSDGYMNTGGTFIGIYTMPVIMRNTPTISVTGTSNLEVAYADSSITTVSGTGVGIISHISNRHQIIYLVTGSGHFSQPAFLRYANSTMSPVFLIQAEL